MCLCMCAWATKNFSLIVCHFQGLPARLLSILCFFFAAQNLEMGYVRVRVIEAARETEIEREKEGASESVLPTLSTTLHIFTISLNGSPGYVTLPQTGPPTTATATAACLFPFPLSLPSLPSPALAPHSPAGT